MTVGRHHQAPVGIEADPASVLMRPHWNKTSDEVGPILDASPNMARVITHESVPEVWNCGPLGSTRHPIKTELIDKRPHLHGNHPHYRIDEFKILRIKSLV
jgi:hypothetical protein